MSTLRSQGPPPFAKPAGWAISIGIHALVVAGLFVLAEPPTLPGMNPPSAGGPFVLVTLVPDPSEAIAPAPSLAPAQTPPKKTAGRPAQSRSPTRSETAISPIETDRSPDPPPPAEFAVQLAIPPSSQTETSIEAPHPHPKSRLEDAAHESANARVPRVARLLETLELVQSTEQNADTSAGSRGLTSAGAISVDARPAWPGPGEVDRPARPRWPIRPEYPPLARRRGDEATVVVEAWVDDGGGVAFSSIVDSGGRAFDESARFAVEQSTFRPARLSGRDIASRVALRIHFELHD